MNSKARNQISRANARCFEPKEADIQKAVVDLLQLDGWRPLRTDPVSDRRRGKGFGEAGMPDYLFLRYRPGRGCQDEAAIAETLWIEFKSPHGLVSAQQRLWHRIERDRGALTLTIAAVDEFLSWYRHSGLMRRAL